LKPVADGGEQGARARLERIELVELRQYTELGRAPVWLAEHDDAEVEQIEGVRVIARVRERSPSDVTVVRVAVLRDAGLDVRREPDLDVRRRRLGAVACGQEEPR
jgi:hypothetical protein